MQTSIDLAFADGVYTFRLGLPQIAEIEKKCDAGIGEVFARLFKGRYSGPDGAIGLPTEAAYRIYDLVEPIRQGLIGGGAGTVDGEHVTVGQHRANELLEHYVIGQPLSLAWDLAASILGALVEGYTPKKDEPALEPAAPSASTSRKRTPTAS